jgi:hypothetical protein
MAETIFHPSGGSMWRDWALLNVALIAAEAKVDRLL